MKLVDLTHTLSNNVPTFEGCGFDLHLTADYGTGGFRVQKMALAAGTGTHLDAPAHIKKNGLYIDEIPIEHLLAPLIIIDVSAQAHETYLITRNDILEFEAKQGKIQDLSFVVFYTGWDKRWPEPSFRNDLKFPAVGIAAAELLIERNIMGLGIDTLSPDRPDSGYPVHALLLGHDKLILECIHRANTLPATGTSILIAPMKIKGATEAPCRVFGIL